MNYSILFYGFIILFILFFYDSKQIVSEGFYDPYKQEERPDNYPNQMNQGFLIEISKYIYTIINSNELNSKQKLHLEELLNLIQFI